jgi:hypothetical protein
MPVERSIKDRGKKVTERFLSISRWSSPNPQSANISRNTGLQASNDLTLIRQADRASGITTPTVPDPSKQSQPAKPDQTSLTQTDEQQQPAEATVRAFRLSLQNWHKLTITSNQSWSAGPAQAVPSAPAPPRNEPHSEPTVWTFLSLL